mgnify:CR=1 FL=1
MGDGGDTLLRPCKFRAGPSDCPANHVPDDEPVHPLLARDDLCAQTRMDAGPSVLPGICTEIRADTPHHKFVRMRGPFENIGVIAIEASLQLDDGDAAVRKRAEAALTSVANRSRAGQVHDEAARALEAYRMRASSAGPGQQA